MGDEGYLIKNCLDLTLDFLKGMDSIKVIDMIIDVYENVRYCKMDEESIKQKFLKVLYNLKNSETLDSLMEERDKTVLNSLLGDLLQIKNESNRFYLGNENFSNLSLDDIYYLLIELKYIKEKEIGDKKEAAN